MTDITDLKIDSKTSIKFGSILNLAFKKDQLIEEIRQANMAYASGIPYMTDSEYDLLWQQLYAIDPHNELLYHTAQNRAALTGKTWHKQPIYGTNKAFNMEDLKPFLTRFGSHVLKVEPKYDGCAAVITVTDSGYTITLEGDGRCGTDITHLIEVISFPFDLKHFQAVELVIPFCDWNPEFGANPRNVVAGWLSRKYEKPPIKITAIPHNYGNLFEEYTYSGSLEAMGEFLLETYNNWSKIYPMDGLMIKVADEKIRLVAGNNGQTNNWSIAWKPPIQVKETTVTDIEWNVSRLGRVIPTVVYDPIELCGTTNNRVTGNNAAWTVERNIIPGSKITIGKAGEIIPKILSVSKINSLNDFLKKEGNLSKFCGLSAITHMSNCYLLYYDFPAQYASQTNSPNYQGYKGFEYKGICFEDSNDIKLSSIPKEQIGQHLGVVYYNKDAYSIHCKEYNQYQEWLENRNTQRYVDVSNHGQKIDGKNLMHCMRLINCGLEIAATGNLTVFRPEAQELLKIRKGEYDLDRLIEQAEEKLIEMDLLFSKSNLPNEVSLDVKHELLIQCRNEFEKFNRTAPSSRRKSRN